MFPLQASSIEWSALHWLPFARISRTTRYPTDNRQLTTGSRLQNSHTELRHFRIQRGRFQRDRDCLASVRRINDLVDPQPRRTVPRIHLLIVGSLYFVIQLLAIVLAQLLAAAFQLLDLDF